MGNIFVLETKSLILKFDKQNGSLISVYSKLSDWFILNRAHLGLSWRLMLPLEGKRNNNAWGHLQESAPNCECGEGFVKFRWEKIVSEFGGTHSIAVTTENE